MATTVAGASFKVQTTAFASLQTSRKVSAVSTCVSRVSVVQRLDVARGLSVCNAAGRESSFVRGDDDLLEAVGFGLSSTAGVVMAVPKKKTSRTKTKQRKAKWYAKGRVAAAKAYALAKSVLTQRGSFVYSRNDDKSAGDEEATDE